MNNIIVVVVFVIIVFVVLRLLYHNLDKENFEEDYDTNNCMNCGNNSLDQCMSCSTCGICHDGRGNARCVNGTKDGPLFQSDCIKWDHIDNNISNYNFNDNNTALTDHEDLMQKYYKLENDYFLDGNTNSCSTCRKSVSSCLNCPFCGLCNRTDGSKKCVHLLNDNLLDQKCSSIKTSEREVSMEELLKTNQEAL